jgi:hypothetical protein
MTVHDLVIANASGSAVRTDLNAALAAIGSNSSNSSAITGANSYPYQWQVRTDVNKLYMRDASTNTTWHEVGDVGVANLGLAKLASPTFTGVVEIANGTNGAPSIAFDSDTDTGLYRSGSNILGLSAGGTASHLFKSDGSEPQVPLKATNGSVSAPSLTFASDTNLGLYRSAADTLSVTTGGTERAYFNSNGLNIKGQLDLRLYDSDSSNYAAIQAPSNIGSNFTLTLPSDNGNANDILKSDGSGGLSFVAISSLITDISGAEVTTYTSSATFTPATGRTGFLFILIGGGGSSGGGRANNDDVAKPARSGQGGTGATALKFYNASELGNNASVTVGAGGAASTGNGNAGGGSSVNPQGSGTTCTAGGGGGSAYAGENANTAGGAAGNCSNHLLGWHGTIGLAGNVSGYAGPNPPEFTAYDYGKGGAGKDHPDAANSAGNAGGAGFVVVFQW